MELAALAIAVIPVVIGVAVIRVIVVIAVSAIEERGSKVEAAMTMMPSMTTVMAATEAMSAAVTVIIAATAAVAEMVAAAVSAPYFLDLGARRFADGAEAFLCGGIDRSSIGADHCWKHKPSADCQSCHYVLNACHCSSSLADVRTACPNLEIDVKSPATLIVPPESSKLSCSIGRKM
jgi:hypothetical protein